MNTLISIPAFTIIINPSAIATIVYKVKNNPAPPYIADLFEVNNSQHHLRNSEFVVPRFRTVAFGKHSISYLGPVIWSKLSQYIRSSESVDIFKKHQISRALKSDVQYL